jgi:hypothetical protein
VNAPWDAATALLALVEDCLGADCQEYARRYVDTAVPVADCDTLAVVIGNLRAYNGSCVGRGQLSANLDVHLIRCCEPSATLTDAGGYTPPSPEAIQAAAACLVRDAFAILECVLCSACDALGSIQGVTACCDDKIPPPEIQWSGPQGLCRSAVVRVPVVFTACCETVT